jgi:glycosyltransferase involved in cell wall biosynthesis
VKEILIVCPDFHPVTGGYANAGTNFVRALAATGEAKIHVVTWVPLGGASELGGPNLSVQRFKRLPEFRYSILLDQVFLGLHLRRLLRRRPFDFVLYETFENPIALAISLGGRRDLRRVGIRIHGCTETELFRYQRGAMNALKRFLQKRLARRVPNIFSTTRFYRDFFTQRILGGDVLAAFKNYPVVPNCVFPNPVGGRRPPAGEIAFLCLGRIDDIGYNQKNFELIAQALAILKRERGDLYGRARVYFIGGGERRRDLEAVVRSLGVAERCELLESLPNAEVHALQASVAASLLVSRYEGLSMFGLEALANGSPLIVSRGTGASELVAEGDNGTLVDPDDPFDLAGAMQRIAAGDAQRMRAASRARFEEHYRPETIAGKFLTSVDLCLASRK